jgi:RimJ/RimL family protein N-acetyltransferase
MRPEVVPGQCGLHHQSSYPDEVEVGWRLAFAHWGHGYATEAATAWLDHGFGTMGFPRVISITEERNTRSLAVMLRFGMTFDHAARVEDDGEYFDAVIYSIAAERWRAREEGGSVGGTERPDLGGAEPSG